MNDITIRIGHALAGIADGFRLVRSRSSLIRECDGGWQAVAIQVLATATPEIKKLAAHAQVRIDSLEARYTQYIPYLDARAARVHPTVAINCDTLLRDKSLANGFATDAASVDIFIDAFGEALNRDIVPWLNRYSRESALYDGLASEDPMEWITSDRLTRFPVLLAILSQRNDQKEFERVATAFLEYCTQKHALVHRPLAESIVSGLRKEVQQSLPPVSGTRGTPVAYAPVAPGIPER